MEPESQSAENIIKNDKAFTTANHTENNFSPAEPIENDEAITNTATTNYIENSPSPAEQQEKINQRREARKRKILENAKSRLEKLGGRPNSFNTDEHENGIFEYPDPEVEPNDISFPFGGSSGDETSSAMHQDLFEEEKPQKEQFIFKYRLHVLISMAFTYILTLAGVMGEKSYSVFIPTGLCIVLEMLLKPPMAVAPLTALIITLCGLPPNLASIVWRIGSIVHDLVIDLALSFFIIATFTLTYDYFFEKNMLTFK